MADRLGSSLQSCVREFDSPPPLSMEITFLGTNGWYCSETGETLCTLIETGKFQILLDAGNGIRKAEKLVKPDKPVYIFLSHYHLDHSVGLHTLELLRRAEKLTVFIQKGSRKILDTLSNHPFTLPYSEIGFPVEIREIGEGAHTKPFPFKCRPLVHADPVFGFRFELEGKVIAYCTDTGVCDNLKELAKGADILITECTNLPETRIKPSWPHMNPHLAAGLAKEVGAKQLVLTHFEAAEYRTLEQRKHAEKLARKTFPRTTAATDGLKIVL